LSARRHPLRRLANLQSKQSKSAMSKVRSTLALLSLGFALPLAAADAAKSVFHTSFASSFSAATSKITQLAGAVSDEQLDWRPSAGVLSMREVILHVAGANYFFGTKVGATLPEGINPQELAKPDATKADLVAVLDKSVTFAQAAVAAVPEADLGKEMEFFGQKASRMRFLMIMVEHAHEHLGQLIAYARSNNVVPPWSK
jgi:uncharacterized damage-inducible protein DinB